MANRQPVWDISQVEKAQASKNFNPNNTSNQKPTSSSKLHNLRNGQINVQTYYDIYIFEERLKQNLLQIKKIQRNYRIITAIWSIFLGYFLWCFVTYKNSTTIYNEENGEVLGYKRNKIYTICLLITSSIGLYYLLTGKIQRKLNGPSKFTQQCNKTLKPFNLQFHGDHKYRLSFYRRIPRRFVEGYILFVTELKKRSKLKKEMQNKKEKE
ncbi:hypothetical protein H8356DRAFT_1723865 [Neocallimastix lanati (nom. inval.)]|jgi:hypothetical protein|uniref:Transmembrane protein 188 n=1 Tax=Neocallimastix californiae TaxID=1754190 RepID=A0A1Y2C497_9FUNG|nr:hypothetical protein H8356DRAFT_1723865 [Neocallimastix sp. JGI-2020a]ORY41135.1 hypothetical protein LY90DRAFT_34074 [Neocallimastix californiae]|eukprot:ORY41135.1 hypothetical protein LY90DRAFT_34074 [Neocallimastix californiae]